VKDSDRNSTIQDYARQFLEAVDIARRNESVRRPLWFTIYNWQRVKPKHARLGYLDCRNPRSIRPMTFTSAPKCSIYGKLINMLTFTSQSPIYDALTIFERRWDQSF
jgi:hypothetical protein